MDFEELAAQLRKPQGDFGKDVALKMNETNRTINLKTIELLDLRAHEAVLEIGMGNGLFCGDILKKHETISYTGYDYSELMVAEAMKINYQYVEDGRATFRFGNASALPFENDFFDKIFAVNTLYFWENPETELTEIMRVLKPDGQFILSIRTKESMKVLPMVQYGFRLYEEKDLKDTLTNIGFSRFEILIEDEPEFKREESTIKLQSLIARCWK